MNGILIMFFLVALWLKTSTLDQHAMDQRRRKITIQGIFTSFFMLQRYTYVVDLQVLLRFNSLLCVSFTVFIHVSIQCTCLWLSGGRLDVLVDLDCPCHFWNYPSRSESSTPHWKSRQSKLC